MLSCTGSDALWNLEKIIEPAKRVYNAIKIRNSGQKDVKQLMGYVNCNCRQRHFNSSKRNAYRHSWHDYFNNKIYPSN